MKDGVWTAGYHSRGETDNECQQPSCFETDAEPGCWWEGSTALFPSGQPPHLAIQQAAMYTPKHSISVNAAHYLMVHSNICLRHLATRKHSLRGTCPPQSRQTGLPVPRWITKQKSPHSPANFLLFFPWHVAWLLFSIPAPKQVAIRAIF